MEFCEVTLAIRVFKLRFLFTNVMYLDKGYNFGHVTFCRPGHNNEDSNLWGGAWTPILKPLNLFVFNEIYMVGSLI